MPLFAQSEPAADEGARLVRVRELLVKSNSFFQEKKYDEALAPLIEAHALQPENSGVLQMIGSLYLMQGKMELASQHFAKALVLDPADASSYIAKAMADKFRGAREEGLASVRKAIELTPSDPRAYYLLGELLGIGGGNVEERIAAFRKAVELDPNYLNEYKFVGYQLQYKEKNEKAAEEAYRIGIEIDPKKEIGFFDLGRLLVGQNRVKEARDLWEKRPPAAKDNTFPNFITLLERAEKMESAKQAYERAPNDPEAILQMGMMTMDGESWVVDGRQEKAIVFFKKALEIKPDFAKAQHAICIAYVQLADTYKSKNKELDEELAKLRKMDPKLADDIDRYRTTYSGGIKVAGPPPPKKP